MPLTELQDISNCLQLNHPSEDNNNTSRRLKGGTDNFNINNSNYTNEFQSKITRIQFIKKVYSILSIMLIIVAVPTLIFNYS